MNDEQIKQMVKAINDLAAALEDVGDKIASGDETLAEAIDELTTAIELR